MRWSLDDMVAVASGTSAVGRGGGLARSGYGAERLLGLLQRLGFRLYEVDEVECCVRGPTCGACWSDTRHRRKGVTNLLCVKAPPGR